MDRFLQDVFANETSSDTVPDGLQYFRLLQLILAGIYAFLSISFVFHVIMAVGIIQIIKKHKSPDTPQNFIYVLTLIIVDAVVLSHLPLLVIEIVESRWTFGLNWCRYFWIAESVNKILSTFILTALCFDRYLLICFPRQSLGGLRSSSTSLVIIMMCVIAAFGLLSPIYLSAKVDNMGSDNQTVLKCVVDWSEDAEQKFTLSLFVVGYCLPLLMMAFFYSRIILQLRRRAQIFQNIHVASRTRTVTKRSFALVAFYFMCWTPFWIMSLYITMQPEPSDIVIIAFYCLHGLVYLNSAMNPVFYALLNRDLRNQHSQALRVHAHRFIRLREYLTGSLISTTDV